MTLLLQPPGGVLLLHCRLFAAFPRRFVPALPFSSSLSASGNSSGTRLEEWPREKIPTQQRWLPGLLAAAVLLSSSLVFSYSHAAAAAAAAPSTANAETQLLDDETFADVPQTLSGGDGEERKRIQKPKSRQAESCTVKCLGTCIRGGAGSPGEGPFNIRRPIVVFKQGFRSRNYCLVECSDICNLIKDGDDGP